MYQVIAVSNQRERERYCALPGLGPLSLDMLDRQRPDELWLLVDAGGSPVARCSLWWHSTPPYADHRLGLIGHYAVKEPAAAAPLLQRACERLAARACTLAVGPMDGNTWQRYRLLTQRGTEPIFFLEPDNPDHWPAHFTDNGFQPLAHYYSALNTNLEQEDPRVAGIVQALQARGISLRPLLPDRFEEELRRIHALSLESFRRNFLYTPISEDDFVAQYRGIRDYVQPQLVLIAEKERQPAGYMFALPDLLQAQRGQVIDTVVIKTLAVHPEYGGAGLGTLLTARCHAAAAQCGYKRVIHALMHETNKSLRISSHWAKTIRRYTLFAKALGPQP